MLKTYRIIPLVFILFLFGFTLFTVSPVFAQTVDQLIERIEKLEAAVFPEGQTVPPVVEQPTLTPGPSKIDGPWDKSMGMRHPARPCMVKGPGRDGTGLGPRGCGPDTRSPEQIASDPYDTNNPVSLAARGGPTDETKIQTSQGKPWSAMVCSVRDCLPNKQGWKRVGDYVQIACEKCTNHSDSRNYPPYWNWTCILPPALNMKMCR